MSLNPVAGGAGGAGLPAEPFVAGEILHTQVIASLGNRRYQVAIAGRLLEAVSSVPLFLGEEVAARVRHAGPPLLLELKVASDAASGQAAPGREGAYAVLRTPGAGGGGEGGASSAALPVLLRQSLEALLSSLPEAQRALLAQAMAIGEPFAPARFRTLLEEMAQALLGADRELVRIGRWIDTLAKQTGRNPVPLGASSFPTPEEAEVLNTDPEGAAARAWRARQSPARLAELLAHLAVREESELSGRSWTKPLREAVRQLDQAIPRGPSALIPFWTDAGKGVLRVNRRTGDPESEARRQHQKLPQSVGIFLEMSWLGAVAVLVSGDGASRAASVSFTADRPQTVERLRAASQELADALVAAGWADAAIEVSLGKRPAAEVFFTQEPGSGSVDLIA